MDSHKKPTPRMETAVRAVNISLSADSNVTKVKNKNQSSCLSSQNADQFLNPGSSPERETEKTSEANENQNIDLEAGSNHDPEELMDQVPQIITLDYDKIFEINKMDTFDASNDPTKLLQIQNSEIIT